MRKTLVLVGILGVLMLAVNALAQEELASMSFTLNSYLTYNRPSPAFLDSINLNNQVREQMASNKMSDGVINMATCWTDVPRRVSEVSEDSNVVAGSTIGFAEGIFLGIARGISGIFDAATYPVSPSDKPLIKPVYTAKDPEQDNLKFDLFSW